MVGTPRKRATQRLFYRALAAGTVSCMASVATAASWSGAVSGDFGDTTKWSTGQVPPGGEAPTVPATIGATGAAFTVTVNNPYTLASVVLSSADATLQTFGNLTLNSFTYTAGTIDGQVIFNDTPGTRSIRFGGQATGSGTFVLQSNGNILGTVPANAIVPAGVTIISRATNTNLNPTLVVAGGTSNNGTITLETAAAVSVASTTTLSINGSSGYTNAGVINFNAGGTGTAEPTRTVSTNLGGYLINDATGTLNVNTATTLQVGLSNAGNINIATGKTLTAGALTHSGGALNISGTLAQGGDFTYSGGSVSGTVTFTGAGIQRLNIGSPAPTSGTFLFQNTAEVFGDIGTGMTVISRATQNGLSPTLTLNNAANHGVITLETAAGVSSPGSSLNLVGSPIWTNAGVLNLSGGGVGSSTRTVQTFSGVQMNNTGTIVAGAMNSSIQVGLTNSGTIEVLAGRTLTAGAMTLSGGAMNLSAGTFISNGDFTYTGGAIDGTVTFGAPGIQKLTLGSQTTASGTFVFTNTSEVSGSIQSGLQVVARASVTGTNQTLTVFGGQSNNGTLTLQVAPGVSSTTSTLSLVGTGVWTNNGTLSLDGGGVGTQPSIIQSFSAVRLANAGVINVNHNSSIQVGALSTGTINVAPGVTLSASTMTIGGGQLNVSGTYLSNGDLTYAGGDVNGRVTLNSPGLQKLTLGSSTLGGGEFIFTRGGEVVGTIQGGMTVSALGTFSGINQTLDVSAGESNNGSLSFGAVPTVSSTNSALSLKGTGVWTNNGQLNFNGGGAGPAPHTHTVQSFNAVSLVNNGMIEVNAPTTIQVGTTNTGTIHVATGQTLSAGNMTMSAGNLQVDGVYNSGGSFRYDGGSIAGTVTFTSPGLQQLTFGNQGSGSGSFVFTGSGGDISGSILSNVSVIARGTSNGINQSLNVAGGASNNGTLTVETAPLVADSLFTLRLGGSGVYTNAGTINFNAAGSGPATYKRTVESFSGVSLLNTGVINVNANTSLQTPMTMQGDVYVNAGATLSAAGLTINGGSLNINGTYLSNGDISYNLGQVNGTVLFSTLGPRKLTVDSHPSPNGTFIFQSNGEVVGDISSQMEVVSRNVSAGINQTMVVHGGRLNFGTLTLESAAVPDTVGVLNLTGTGVWENRGTLNFNAGGSGANGPTRSVRSFTNVAVLNRGTINVNTATTFQTAVRNNTGTINIAAGKTLTAGTMTLAGGALNIAGTYLGQGDVTYLGGSVAGTVNFTGGTRTLFVGQQTAGSGTFAFSGGAGQVSPALTTGAIPIGVTVRATANNVHTTLAIAEGVTNNGTITIDSATTAGGSSLGRLHVAGASMANNGTINFNGGAGTTIGNSREVSGGTLVNNAGGVINFNGGSSTTFLNNVVNNGTMKNTDSFVRFNGTFTNNGAYLSDPAVNEFVDLVVTESGFLKGVQGDVFVVSGSFTNASTRKDEWDTRQAELKFTGGEDHTVTVVGDGEFAFGTIRVEEGATITLTDGDSQAGGGIYATTLVVPIVDNKPDFSVFVAPEAEPGEEAPPPIAIYFDPAAAGNQYIVEYLEENPEPPPGITVAPGLAPEPATMGVIGVAAVGLLARRRRRHAMIGA